MSNAAKWINLDDLKIARALEPPPAARPAEPPVYERGTVRFYRDEREHGFIAPDDGTADVFVHARTLEMSGIQTLAAGQRVEYERVPDNRGFQAYRLQLV